MLKKIASSLSENGADAWVIYDFASQNPAFVSIFGKNFSTRKCFAVIDKAMNNTLICHSIDALGIGKAEVTKNFRLKVYNTWQQLDLLLEETLSDYDTVMMEISENGLMPRSSYVDYGTVCSVKRFVKNIISSADLFQALAATFFGESLEFHKKAAITVNAIKDEAFDLISRTVRQKGLVSEYEIQQFILKRFSDNGMVTDSAPIVAIEKNAASPHYEPTKDNPLLHSQRKHGTHRHVGKIRSSLRCFCRHNLDGICRRQRAGQIQKTFRNDKDGNRQSPRFSRARTCIAQGVRIRSGRHLQFLFERERLRSLHRSQNGAQHLCRRFGSRHRRQHRQF